MGSLSLCQVNALNSRMCVEDRLWPFSVYVRNEESSFCKLLQSYPKVANNPLEKFATDETIAENDTATLRYV